MTGDEAHLSLSAELDAAIEHELPLWAAHLGIGRPEAPWAADLDARGFGDELEVLRTHHPRPLDGGESRICGECGHSWIRRTLTGGAVAVGCQEVGAACQVLEDCRVLPADLTVVP